MKIKTGDKVKVISGKNRGKTGKVIQVLQDKKKGRVFVVVEGVNIVKKHIRSREKGKPGQTIELPAPVYMSKVMLIDPKSNTPTRVGYKQEGQEKKRIAKKTNEFIDVA